MLKIRIILGFLLIISLIAVSLVLFQDRHILKRDVILGPSSSTNIGPPDYRIVFVGDSMTAYLGNFDELRGYLKKDYPNKNFLLLNYGFGSTNILSVKDRLETDSSHSGRLFEAINNIPFDLILIESFGHNPLSEYPLEEGLRKQNQALGDIIASITQKHPRSAIVFVATIAPNKDRYGEGTVTLQPDQKLNWVAERDAYIQNHILYAQTHHIPLINIYQKSLKDGTGNIDYINTTDFIHPSPTGVYFISQEIANFIFNQKLLPFK